MPIYEFFCPDCNTIFNFLSRTVNTQKVPSCPACKRIELDRKVSLFAVTGRAKEKSDTASGGDDPMDKLPFDEAKMAGALETLAKEAEHINEDDPRQAANLMRKLSDMTGIKYGDKMQEAIGRMESGEDPEAIEAELGDALEHEDPFQIPGMGDDPKGKVGMRRSAPKHDDTLYEM